MNTSPLRVVLFSAISADETQSQPVNVEAYPHVTIFLTSDGTTSSGVVTIEEADYDPKEGVPYGGTWSSITTINASDFTGGACKAYHCAAPSCYSWIRVRVSTAIGGGGTISGSLRAV